MAHADPTIDLILSIFATTLKDINEAVADVPDDRLAEQPAHLVNHPAWTLAHLAAAAGFIPQLLGEAKDPGAQDEMKNFGPGSIPKSDRAAYASKAELLALLSARHAHAVAAVQAKHIEHFPLPTPEHLRSFAPTIGRIIVYLVAAHESYHLGQLMQWRRAAGLKTT